jgi:hypothetical protein
MPQKLINHSPDLKRLRDNGFEIEVKNGYALVHHVPYVNSSKEIRYGTLISNLTLAGNITIRPDTHVIHFIGEHPCDKQGFPLTGIQHESRDQVLTDGVISNHSFSNRPMNGFNDYYEKFTSYIDIIMAPAFSLDNSVTAQSFAPIVSPEEMVFNYYDTNSSRANINMITKKLENQKIGIIGLGGTGSYILDLVAKTPVAEIHIIDGDVFLQHNAFRAPGAPSIDELRELKKKTDYLRGIYSKMHRNIISHNTYINEENVFNLLTLDFIFISIDDGPSKKLIIDKLLEAQISFIDVGIGLERVENSLIGSLRVTTATREKNDHLEQRISFANGEDDEYSSNIQIAELNALNASLAVIKWKKLNCFYQDLYREHDSTYTINTGDIFNEDHHI